MSSSFGQDINNTIRMERMIYSHIIVLDFMDFNLNNEVIVCCKHIFIRSGLC